MNIDQIHKNWTKLGKEDPMWVVLTDPEKKNGRWDEAEFFQTGVEEITKALEKIEKQGVTIKTGRALDFGCGLGRLSQALRNRFDEVHGVDVSASMIEKAKALNKIPARVHYFLNVKPDLGDFKTGAYDFIYSNITLQHVPQRLQENYIADFMRLLAPGGIACFQIVYPTSGWGKLVPEWFLEFYSWAKRGGKSIIPVYGIAPQTVKKIISAQGGHLIREEIGVRLEGVMQFLSYHYLVSRA